jgi:hypothetical protein
MSQDSIRNISKVLLIYKYWYFLACKIFSNKINLKISLSVGLTFLVKEMWFIFAKPCFLKLDAFLYQSWKIFLIFFLPVVVGTGVVVVGSSKNVFFLFQTKKIASNTRILILTTDDFYNVDSNLI